MTRNTGGILVMATIDQEKHCVLCRAWLLGKSDVYWRDGFDDIVLSY